MQRSVNKAIQDVKALQKELKTLHKEATAAYTKENETSLFRAMGGTFQWNLLHLYCITLDLDLCAAYCTYFRANWRGICKFGNVNELEMATWLHDQATPTTQHNCKTNVDGKSHFTVAKWLAEKEVLQLICQLNAKGMTPPAHLLLQEFCDCFPVQSRGAIATTYMERLQTNVEVRKRWLRSLRESWQLTFRTLPQRPPLTNAEISRKASSNILIYEPKYEHDFEAKNGSQN